MRYRILGRTGLKISAIGFGGIPLQGISFENAEAVLKEALICGINFFDTSHASSYGDSEEKFGMFLPEDVIIATKTKEKTPNKIREDLEASLTVLGRDKIDVYQNHCVESLKILYQLIENGSLEFLEQAKREGRIGFLGISTHREDVALKALELDRWDVIQYPFNPIKKDLKVVSIAKKRNIGYVAMKPLDGGNILKANLALRWILQHNVSSAIPGMTKIEEVRENAETGSMSALSLLESNDLMESIKGLEGMCQACGYCEPSCPKKIPIGIILYLHNYAIKMKLPEKALARFISSVKRKGNPYNCTDCGKCEENCHNNLAVRKKLREAADYFAEKLGKGYDELFESD